MKLIDFGIASSVQSDMTSVFKDAQAGTFNYMSPEAIQATHSTSGNQPGFKVTTCKASSSSSSSLALQLFKFGRSIPHDRCPFCSVLSS
jgi:serine/threonine protein kinase